MSVLAMICNILVTQAQRLCAFSYSNRQRHLTCHQNHLNSEVERDSSAETSGVNPSKAIISLTLSCLYLPSPDAAASGIINPGSLPLPNALGPALLQAQNTACKAHTVSSYLSRVLTPQQ